MLQVSFCNTCYTLHNVNSKDFTIYIVVDNSEHYHKVLKKLLTKSNILDVNPQVCSFIEVKESLDLSTLIQKHIKVLKISSESNDSLRLTASSEFPFCPHFTEFAAQSYHMDDSVPAAFMKAVKDGKFPNLKRIELDRCTLNDCEWPEVPEFCCDFPTETISDLLQMKKLLLNLTELTYKTENIDHLIKVLLEKLSVLKLYDTNAYNLKCLNNVLKLAFLPNLSKLSVLETTEEGIDIDMSADSLEILSEKLTSLQITELTICRSYGFTGNMSVLFTHSLPTLNTLILTECYLNSDHVQSLAKAEAEGKFPQIKHLDISLNLNADIGDLFTHSAQWNRLTTLATSDANVLNVQPEFLISLEELHMDGVLFKLTPQITRQWLCLKVIEVYPEDVVRCIVEGVERGMFPALTTVRGEVPIPLEFKLLRANVSVEPF